MAILKAGTFKTGDYRKAIPVGVKLASLIRYLRLNSRRENFDIFLSEYELAALRGQIRFDHRPALEARDYDTVARDFIPPQNDPNFIDAILSEEHNARTFGAYGVTARGDVPNRARLRDISNKHEDFRSRQAAKAGHSHERRNDIPKPTKKSQKPKAKIRNRSNWPKGQKISQRANPWGKK